MTLSHNASFLLGHLHAALPMAEIGGVYQASDHTEQWMISTQVLEGQATGKIVLACLDDKALQGFANAARAEGHLVAPAGPDHTVLITPMTARTDRARWLSLSYLRDRLASQFRLEI